MEPRSEQGSADERRRRRFTDSMTVAQAVSAHPRARWVISSYQIGACTSCAISDEETLAAVSTSFDVPIGELLAALNALE